MPKNNKSLKRSFVALNRIGLLLSIVYFLAGGVLALWSPKDGFDLHVSYLAGICSVNGASPYLQEELIKTGQIVDTPGFEMTAGWPFAYPPSWVPFCVLISHFPWELARGFWKLLNLFFLVGSVLLSFRLFQQSEPNQSDKYRSWYFALLLSPTITVLVNGQTSLFVLLSILLTLYLSKKNKPIRAGFIFALSLTKPQLVFPIFIFLLWRRQFKTIVAGLAVFAGLAFLGLFLSNSDLSIYLAGVKNYMDHPNLDPTSPYNVGVWNLASGVFGLSPTSAKMVSLLLGFTFLLILFLRDFRHKNLESMEEVVPLLMVLSLFFFSAHSYDLVFLIPFFIWAVEHGKQEKAFIVIQIICLIYILPLKGVSIIYENILSNFISVNVYQVTIEPFRSWILVLLFAMTMSLWLRKVPRLSNAKTAL